MEHGTVTARRNPVTGNTQLPTRDLLALLQTNFPFDAHCVLGITTQDLYPNPAWNFVFGEASILERVGVYSFARYHPRFYGKGPADAGQLILRRSCKVLAHETCHMFGIRHCVFFNCRMNGSNHLDESDARPLYLCPVDLRKLQDSVGFDLVDRYRRLRNIWKCVGFDDEATWVEERLEWIEKGP